MSQEQIDRLRYRGGHDVDGRSVFNDALDLAQSLLTRAEAAERERDHTQYAYEREREAKDAAEREVAEARDDLEQAAKDCLVLSVAKRRLDALRRMMRYSSALVSVNDDPVVALCEVGMADAEVWRDAGEEPPDGAETSERLARALLVAWEALRNSECAYGLCGMDQSTLCDRCNSVARVIAIVEGRDE